MVIRMEELTKRYGAQTAVDRLSLEVREGEVFGFLGPNGAGKTTTMLMLLGLTEPTSGQVRVCGFDPARNPLKVKALIGYLPENVGFYDDMDARQNLRYIARLNGIPDRVSAARIAKLLEEVDLAKESDKKVGSYSKGMRQRLGIAEVLVKEPRVVFLDEPTVGLDPDGTSRMLDLIHSLSRPQDVDSCLNLLTIPKSPTGSDHDQESLCRRPSRNGPCVGGEAVYYSSRDLHEYSRRIRARISPYTQEWRPFRALSSITPLVVGYLRSMVGMPCKEQDGQPVSSFCPFTSN
jgi:ABC-2 type transport system ATP-binding protein